MVVMKRGLMGQIGQHSAVRLLSEISTVAEFVTYLEKNRNYTFIIKPLSGISMIRKRQTGYETYLLFAHVVTDILSKK